MQDTLDFVGYCQGTKDIRRINISSITCHPSCKLCKTVNSQLCQSCFEESNFELVDEKCVCKQNYYYDPTLIQCIQCPVQCQGCTFNNQIFTCKACSPKISDYHNRKTFIQSNLCECQEGYYQSQDILQCYPCHESCLTCKDSSITGCLTCSPLQYRKLNINKCDCLYPIRKETTSCQDCEQNLKCPECDEYSTFNLQYKTCVANQIPSNLSQETIDNVKKSVEVTSTVAIGVSSSTSVLFSIASPNANFLQQFLSVQKINFLLLINIPLPQILYEFYKSICGSNPIQSLQKINFFKYIQNERNQDVDKHFYQGKFQSEQIHSSIIYNSGGIIIIICIIQFIFFIAVLLDQKRKKQINLLAINFKNESDLPKKPHYQTILDKFIGIIFLQVHELLFLVLSYSLCLQFFAYAVDIDDDHQGVKAIKGIFIALIMIYSIGSVFYFIRFINTFRVNKNDKKAQVNQQTLSQIIFDSYIQEYIIDLRFQKNFRLVQIGIENIFIPMCIIVFESYPLAQITFCLCLQALILFMAIWKRPSQFLLNNIELIMQNTIWLGIFSTYLALYSKVKSFDQQHTPQSSEIDQLNKLSIVIMSCCLLLLFLPPIFLFIKLLMKLPSLIKQIKQKLKEKSQSESNLSDSSINQLEISQEISNLYQQQSVKIVKSTQINQYNQQMNLQKKKSKRKIIELQKDLDLQTSQNSLPTLLITQKKQK